MKNRQQRLYCSPECRMEAIALEDILTASPPVDPWNPELEEDVFGQ